MVFVNQGLPTGPLSEEKLQRLFLARYALAGIWMCALLRLVFENPLNGIATGFSAITGTYTFMNDKRFTGCYDFMAANCLACGNGGSQCMGPFISICLINSIFDMFRMFSLLSSGFDMALLVGLTLLSILFQGYASVSCFRVYKDIVGSLDSPLRQEENRVPFLSAVPSFVPFAGEGRRLG